MAKNPKPLRIEPLWARVDRNRVRLAVFVAAFVLGSAVLLALAFVAVPGSLFGLVFSSPEYWRTLALAVAAAIGLLLALGGIASAVQLSNAEDWVRNRFTGAPLDAEAYPALARAVSDMAIAGGLAQPPALLLFDVPSVNACAIGTSRKRPVIGVTRGFVTEFTEAEQRAVIATLVARITRGDILVGTAMAALMGPLKAIRDMRAARKAADDTEGGAAEEASGVADPGCAADGCVEGCGCLGSALDDSEGCGSMIVVVLFVAFVIAMTWVAVTLAAWLVTIWGRALHRTGHEKADAEGMLLLKEPGAMLSALGKAISSSNEIADGDPSYDGIFYASTSGTSRVEKVERRRYDRLREVLGTEGLGPPPPELGG